MSTTSPEESPPTSDSTSPPSDSQSPPSSGGSTSPPSDDSSPPPPSPDDSSSQSPPPPSSDDSSQSSPPPPSTEDDSSQSPPPPPDDSSQSPPPPPEQQDSPPPPSEDNGDDDSPPPPPPKSSGSSGSSSSSSSSSSPPPPPSSSHSGSSSSSSRSPPPPSMSLPPPPSSNNSSFDNEKAIIAGAAAGAGLLLLLMIVFMVSCCKRKKRKPHGHDYYPQDSRANISTGGYYNSGQHDPWQNKLASSEHGWLGPPPPPPAMMSSSEMSSAGFSGGPPLPPPHPAMALGFNQSSFTYGDLAAATGGFAQSNLLGQGGFGFVHKGVLPNGKEIAVKSLKANSGQGEREFQAEVDIISRVHHRHLVSLVGYCISGSQRLLVYEFVANGTLEYHLHGAGRPSMEWPARLRIALGSAKGFAYLHEDCHPRIIHRDIKAANILLDENFEAKVADFGLAKLSSDTNTHVSTRIMGTFGYLAPEYASSGKLTEKSDVYSYGIMLLELISGRRPVDISRDDDDDTLVDWARPHLVKVIEGGSFEELVDPRLGNNYDPQEMHRMVACAAACIRHSARRRPKMSQIVRALEGDVSLDDLNEGVKPGNSATFGSSGGNSSEFEVRRLRNNPGALLSSEEFSDHGTTSTGEFANSTTSPGNRPPHI